MSPGHWKLLTTDYIIIEKGWQDSCYTADRQLKLTARVQIFHLLHPYHFTVAPLPFHSCTNQAIIWSGNSPPTQQICLFSLSRRFISTPKLSLEKFKWATDAQSWTNKTLHCFEEVLAFPHILHPTIKLPGTDSSFSAQYLAIWHNKKTDTRGSKSKKQKKLGGKKYIFTCQSTWTLLSQRSDGYQIFVGNGNFQNYLTICFLSCG